MKPLHTDDIVAGDGQIMRQQMIDNFKAIEQELTILRENNAKLKKLQTALGLSDDDLNNL